MLIFVVETKYTYCELAGISLDPAKLAEATLVNVFRISPDVTDEEDDDPTNEG